MSHSPAIAHVRILSINDFHGQLPDSAAKVGDVSIGGAATLSAYVQQQRAGNPKGTVFVSAGDMLGASPPESSLLRHESTVAVLEAMGLDIATFGNHEFDAGYAEAIRIIRGDGALAAAQRAQGIPVTATSARRRRGGAGPASAARGASGLAPAGSARWPGTPFPWISANVVHAATGKPVLPPYSIRTINGVRVAFVGATTGDLKNVTLAAGIPNIKALDPATAVNRYIPEIRAKGVKAIVVIVHEGGDPDPAKPGALTGGVADLAKGLDGEVDAIISGHSHTEYATKIDGRPVVQAGSYAKALGVVDLKVDRATGQVVGSGTRLVRNDEAGIQPDPFVAGLVAKFHEAVAPRTERVVIKLAAPVTRELSKSGESALGSLIADAQRAVTKADVALMNPGGVRQDLTAAGPLTWGTLFGVQPFANRVIAMSLSGAKLKEVLEQQLSRDEPKILQASGITVHMDLTKPAGQRIVSVTMADGSALDPAKQYKVAVNSFLADGGDGFTALKEGTDRTDAGVDLDALVQYLEQGGAVPTAPPGRIILDAGELPAGAH